MAEIINQDIVKAIRVNRGLIFISILILLGILYAIVIMKPTPIVPPDDGGPGPISSGKIKKPGTATSDLVWIIERRLLDPGMAGAPGYLHVDLIEQDIDGFDSTYTYDAGGGSTATNNYEVTSTTIKIDKDRDKIFEPEDGEVELQISKKTCAKGTCLEWKNLSTDPATTYAPCFKKAADGTPVCTNNGIPPEFFGWGVPGGWTITRSSSGDPEPIVIQDVGVRLK